MGSKKMYIIIYGQILEALVKPERLVKPDMKEYVGGRNILRVRVGSSSEKEDRNLTEQIV